MARGTEQPIAKHPRARNPLGEGGRLREELIEAAGRLLASGVDPDLLSLRAVAREAGIAAPSVYLQFESKDALLLAVVEANFARFQRAIEDGLARGKDPLARLRNGCLAYCHFAAEQPGSYRVIFETQLPIWPDVPMEEVPGMAAFHRLVDGVAACIAAGQAEPGDPFLIATNIWATLHGMVTLRRRLPRFPWPDLEAQLESVLDALTGFR